MSRSGAHWCSSVLLSPVWRASRASASRTLHSPWHPCSRPFHIKHREASAPGLIHSVLTLAARAAQTHTHTRARARAHANTDAPRTHTSASARAHKCKHTHMRVRARAHTIHSVLYNIAALQQPYMNEMRYRKAHNTLNTLHRRSLDSENAQTAARHLQFFAQIVIPRPRRRFGSPLIRTASA